MSRHSPSTPHPAAKKSVNLSVREALIDEARSYNMNLSATLEDALEQRLREARRQRWLEENREAIAHRKARIAREGMWNRHLVRF